MQSTTMDEFFDGRLQLKRMAAGQQPPPSAIQQPPPAIQQPPPPAIQSLPLMQQPSIKSSLSDLCTQFANVLQSKMIDSTDTSCTVMKMRNIPVEIMEKKSKSALTLAAMFSYEGLDSDFIALNLGETVILQEEISEFIYTLEQNGIIVSALHNHWLFTNPPIMYVHFQSIDNPIIFAAKTARAMNVLK